MAEQPKNESDAKIVDPDYSLKKKVGNADVDKVIDSKVVEEAKKVVEGEKTHLVKDMLEDTEKMERFFEEALSIKDKEPYLKKMTDIALNIKSDAGMADKPLATDFAKSLYQLFMVLKDIDAEDAAIIRAHIHAIHNVFANKLSDSGEQVERELLERLSNYTKMRQEQAADSNTAE